MKAHIELHRTGRHPKRMMIEPNEELQQALLTLADAAIERTDGHVHTVTIAIKIDRS